MSDLEVVVYSFTLVGAVLLSVMGPLKRMFFGTRFIVGAIYGVVVAILLFAAIGSFAFFVSGISVAVLVAVGAAAGSLAACVPLPPSVAVAFGLVGTLAGTAVAFPISHQGAPAIVLACTAAGCLFGSILICCSCCVVASEEKSGACFPARSDSVFICLCAASILSVVACDGLFTNSEIVSSALGPAAGYWLGDTHALVAASAYAWGIAGAAIGVTAAIVFLSWILLPICFSKKKCCRDRRYTKIDAYDTKDMLQEELPFAASAGLPPY